MRVALAIFLAWPVLLLVAWVIIEVINQCAEEKTLMDDGLCRSFV